MRAERYLTLVATESYRADITCGELISSDSWSSFRGITEDGFYNLSDGGCANGDGNDGENNKSPDDDEVKDTANETDRLNAKMKSGGYVAWVLDDEVNKIITGMGEFASNKGEYDIIIHGPPTRETSTYLQPVQTDGFETDAPIFTMENVTTITMTQTLVQVVAAN